MFKSAMGYLGGMTAGAIAGDLPGIIPDPIDDALVGSIVDVAGHKIAVKRRIGEGGFAFVYEAEDINDSSKKYALKRLLAMDSEKQQQIVKEISLMKMLSGHGNIVGFLSAAEAKGVSQKGCDEFLVLMEFCPTNLSEIMSKRHCRPYPPATVAGIFAQITSAVAKMHRSQPAIVHRDLKLENLLVDATGKVVKLCDFGSATTEKFTPDENWTMSQRNNLEEEMAKHTTPMYRAPEMLDTWSNYPVYIAADVWALGCLLYFLCYGRHPFEDSAKLAIINGNYRIPEVDITFEAFHDLIRQMLVVDPTFRPSIGQVQEHLASIAETHGFNISSGDIDFELSSSLSSPEISPSSEAFPTTTTSTASSTDNQTAPAGPGLMSSLRGGAGSFMGKIRDTSKAVIQTVQHSMASRDLDLHLITERIAAMSYPAEGMESAMRNHIDDIASILEIRHPNHYAVYNLSERSYNVQKFTTGLVKQPGWTTTRPSGFKIVLETMNSCLEFLKSDPKNVIVIHCLDGKSNTAVLIAGLLMAAGFVKNYKDGLKFFGLKRCDPVLEGHHRVLLRYLETAFTGPSIYMESRVITLTSIVLEPVPMFSKNSDGCRPFIEVFKCDDVSPLKVAPSSEYASLAFFTAFDEEAILKVNVKLDGDVIISIFHARQSSLGSLFANRFEKILICRLYFHTGFLGGNSSSLRFRLRDLDCVSSMERFSKDFKVVVNFRPEPDVKSTALLCKDADLSLLFGTRDELVNNRDMMGASISTNDFASPLNEDLPPPKAPPRQKSKETRTPTPSSDDILISPVIDLGKTDAISTKPFVSQPGSLAAAAATQPLIDDDDNILLDLGGGGSGPDKTNPQKNATVVADVPILDHHFAAAFSVNPSSAKSGSNPGIDSLLDISGSDNPGPNLLAPNMMKTSSSAEFLPNMAKGPMKQKDPFDFLGLAPTKSGPAPSMADDMVSKMLGDFDMGPNITKQPPKVQQTTNQRPNYNVHMSFNSNSGGNQSNGGIKMGSTTNVPPKMSKSTFEDLLGPSFTPSSGNGHGQGQTGKSIGAMQKAETMKTMTAEEAHVFAWKDGKSRNLRALLCSLHTVIWPNSRWSQCGMHQLVGESDVNRMYKKACLAVHPDKQMGTDNEELSKMIFIELNDAWAEFNNKD